MVHIKLKTQLRSTPLIFFSKMGGVQPRQFYSVPPPVVKIHNNFFFRMNPSLNKALFKRYKSSVKNQAFFKLGTFRMNIFLGWNIVQTPLLG